MSLLTRDARARATSFDWNWSTSTPTRSRSYHEQIFRSIGYAATATVLALIISFPLAYFIAFKARPLEERCCCC